MSALPGKYADQAVPCLYHGLIEHGARAGNIKAKIAGGSRMFNVALGGGGMDVGRHNIEAVTSALRNLKVSVLGDDLGGNFGRKVEFELEHFKMKVEDFGKNVRTI